MAEQGKVEGCLFHEHLALKALPHVNQWQKIKPLIFPRYQGKKKANAHHHQCGHFTFEKCPNL
jgi:hypothetical protein